ncbi:MAG: MiaB/RimO family radical SAM methylthiotransferase, partial [Candidatus Omnitrophica bacterium]|nr:MiaB/RimO family radical SAM methylthiotransferase [Candidatus Omnitrophota bacterium]
ESSRQVAVSGKERPVKCVNPAYREKTPRSYVNIMYGCNNFCSYCIVPYVRGREVSRPVSDIIQEMQDLVEKGISDIMLLGQNVNSYQGVGIDQKRTSFIELLKLINDIKGIKKISFMTSHPKDVSMNLFKAIKDLEHVTKDLHLPLQSGSNRILQLMNRGYTIEHYMKLAREYRKINPKGRFTTDIIVGFPTETEEDFDMTEKVMEEIRFDGAYVFKYSPRPPAKSAEIKDDVSLLDKKKRNNILLNLQKEKRP